jgi:tetratricopeptide (TPR) repeat protein
MRRWIAGIALGLALLSLASTGFAQDNEAAKANVLFQAGKRPEALPLYEDLAKAHPNEMLYFERLADCLGAEAAQLSDPAEIKAVRTRMRDAAKRAIELGDTTEFVRIMANIDPDQPQFAGIDSPGKALLMEAEKAFTAGDFPTAMAKYTAAANADPKLYDAPLFAGDTAFRQGDLKAAALWFARAIAIDPDRETAYRYWGDAILKYGNDPMAAREKFIDAIVAEPYSRLAWQGIKQWAQLEKAVLMVPKIERPAGPKVDPKNPKTTEIQLNIGELDEKKNPGGFAWMMYSMVRASYHGDLFKQNFPDEKEYRHTLKEEDAALSIVASTAEGKVATNMKGKKTKPETLDESLRNLVELNTAGMLDCWILINGADNGIAQDYDAYRKQHRQLLHDYLSRFVVHGGVNPTQ